MAECATVGVALQDSAYKQTNNGLHHTAPPVDINNKVNYEVHHIKAHHMHHNELQFLTLFIGYDSSEDMWLSAG